MASCPRCGKTEVSELQRLRPERENVILRCRRCGHLWSPVEVPAVGAVSKRG